MVLSHLYVRVFLANCHYHPRVIKNVTMLVSERMKNACSKNSITLIMKWTCWAARCAPPSTTTTKTTSTTSKVTHSILDSLDQILIPMANHQENNQIHTIQSIFNRIGEQQTPFFYQKNEYLPSNVINPQQVEYTMDVTWLDPEGREDHADAEEHPDEVLCEGAHSGDRQRVQAQVRLPVHAVRLKCKRKWFAKE